MDTEVHSSGFVSLYCLLSFRVPGPVLVSLVLWLGFTGRAGPQAPVRGRFSSLRADDHIAVLLLESYKRLRRMNFISCRDTEE
jgi:hypothetical protein